MYNLKNMFTNKNETGFVCANTFNGYIDLD